MILHNFIIRTCHVPAARKAPINDAQPNYSLHGNCIMVLVVRTKLEARRNETEATPGVTLNA